MLLPEWQKWARCCSPSGPQDALTERRAGWSPPPPAGASTSDGNCNNEILAVGGGWVAVPWRLKLWSVGFLWRKVSGGRHRSLETSGRPGLVGAPRGPASRIRGRSPSPLLPPAAGHIAAPPGTSADRSETKQGRGALCAPGTELSPRTFGTPREHATPSQQCPRLVSPQFHPWGSLLTRAHQGWQNPHLSPRP